MAKQPKGFGASPKSKSKKKLKPPKPMLLKPLTDTEFVFQKEARLRQIFTTDPNLPQVSTQSLHQYAAFLKEALDSDTPLSIDEPVEWEVPFIFGSGPAQTHQSLRQNNPSYLDTYHFVALAETIPLDTGLQAIVVRTTDQQRFTLPLIYFRASQSKSTAVADYRFWWEQYRP